MNQYKDIYVLIEQRHGVIAGVSYELLAEARKLVAQIPQLSYSVVGVIFGHKISKLCQDVIARGADKVIYCDDSLLASYSTQFYSDALTQIIRAYLPNSVLIGATVLGRDLAPRVAGRVNTGLTADATKVDIEVFEQEQAQLLVTRPAFGGNLFATIACKTRPQMATIRPNVFVASEHDQARIGTTTAFQPIWTSMVPQVVLHETIAKKEKHIDITKANLIISCGRGMAGHLDMVYDVAKELGATVAVSRAIVDQGQAPKEIQVGQTGKTVRPAVYIACGISGAAQHVAGMEHSEFIIAINQDPNAAIFKVANMGFVGNAVEILPLLVKELKQIQ